MFRVVHNGQVNLAGLGGLRLFLAVHVNGFNIEVLNACLGRHPHKARCLRFELDTLAGFRLSVHLFVIGFYRLQLVGCNHIGNHYLVRSSCIVTDNSVHHHGFLQWRRRRDGHGSGINGYPFIGLRSTWSVAIVMDAPRDGHLLASVLIGDVPQYVHDGIVLIVQTGV